MFDVIVITAVIVPTYLPGTRYAASTRLQTCCRYDTDRYRKNRVARASASAVAVIHYFHFHYYNTVYKKYSRVRKSEKTPRAASLPSHDQRVSQQSVSECHIPSIYILYIHRYIHVPCRRSRLKWHHPRDTGGLTCIYYHHHTTHTHTPPRRG